MRISEKQCVSKVLEGKNMRIGKILERLYCMVSLYTEKYISRNVQQEAVITTASPRCLTNMAVRLYKTDKTLLD